MVLVMVAEDEGFFDKAGVDVEIKEFTAGKFALQAFLGGSLDIAVSGEVPVTLSTLQGNKFRVLAQVVERTINECRVVVPKEPGLDTAEKYFGAKKRKLATSFGGGPEFFTYSFFQKHGIGDDQVELISQKPEDMPAALLSGSVDGISIFDPFARVAEREMGEEGTTFADADIYSELYVADVMQQTIDEKPDQLRAFLKGLYDAQFFIRDNPDPLFQLKDEPEGERRSSCGLRGIKRELRSAATAICGFVGRGEGDCIRGKGRHPNPPLQPSQARPHGRLRTWAGGADNASGRGVV